MGARRGCGGGERLGTHRPRALSLFPFLSLDSLSLSLADAVQDRHPSNLQKSRLFVKGGSSDEVYCVCEKVFLSSGGGGGKAAALFLFRKSARRRQRERREKNNKTSPPKNHKLTPALRSGDVWDGSSHVMGAKP